MDKSLIVCSSDSILLASGATIIFRNRLGLMSDRNWKELIKDVYKYPSLMFSMVFSILGAFAINSAEKNSPIDL